MINKEPRYKLDICTVVFSKEHLNYIKHNIQLTKKINDRGVSVSWIVVDNSGGKVKFPKKAYVKVVKGSPFPKIKERVGSFHHAAGLNIAKNRSKNRFLLILDPDFFVIYPDWVNAVLTHMVSRQLSFMAVPWHPRWFGKKRYIPAPHCLFIDTKKVNRKKIDFLPLRFVKRAPSIFFSDKMPRILRISYGIFRIISLRDRSAIGSSGDTGIRLLNLIKGPIQLELFVPVFMLGEQFRGPNYALSKINRFIEKFLPEELCFLPKKEDSYLTSSSKGSIFKNFEKKQYELFYWNNIPFGFHIRGMSRNRQRYTIDEELRFIRDFIKQYTSTKKQKN